MRQVLYRCVAALCVCTGSVMAWQCAQTGTNETGCRWGQPWIYMFTSLIPFFVPHQRDKNSVLLELESDLKGLLWPWGCRDLEDSSLRVRSEFSDSVIWCIWRRGSQHKGLSKGVLRCVHHGSVLAGLKNWSVWRQPTGHLSLLLLLRLICYPRCY